MLKDRNDDSHIYKEDFEDIQIPDDLLAYAFRQQQPLYQLMEDIRQKYKCQTDAQVYDSWKIYKKEYLNLDNF